MPTPQHHDPFVLCDACRRHCTHPQRGTSHPGIQFSELVEKAKWCDSCSIFLEGIRKTYGTEDEDEDLEDSIDGVEISSNERFGSIAISNYQDTVLFYAREGSLSDYVKC